MIPAEYRELVALPGDCRDAVEDDYRAIMQSLQRLENLLARVADARQSPARGLASSEAAAPRTL